MKVIIILLFALAVAATAEGQLADPRWQAKAVEKYPSLAVKDSSLHKQFINAYEKRRKTDPAFFSDPKWPLILADELVEPLPPAVAPAPVTSEWRRWTTLSRETQHIVLIVGAVVSLVALSSFIETIKERRRRRRICKDADEYVRIASKTGILPSVETTIILKPGENAVYYAATTLYETRAVRSYQSGFTRFRIAKGISIGGSVGQAASNQEWTKISSGTLTVTNERIIFEGDGASRTLAIGKIVSAVPTGDSVEISVENRQKSMVFEAANPRILGLIVNVLAKPS